MFQQLFGKFEFTGFRKMSAKGLVACPECGEKTGDLSGQVVRCQSCGTAASVAEWTSDSRPALPARQASSVTPPSPSKIVREQDATGSIVWQIPASGHSGGMLFFGIVWCAVTAVMSAGFLATILSGKEIEGNVPEWWLILFASVFWATGLGVLYAGFRVKYARHRITAGNGLLTLRRELFGRSSEKSLPLESVRSVEEVEFYQKDYQPVHGIEIRAEKGKLRFGSALTPEEKSWMTANLRRALLKPPAHSLHEESAHAGGRQSYFSITLPSSRGHSSVMGVVLMVMALVFIAMTSVMFDGFPDLPGKSVDWFDRIFGFLTGGFVTIWILFNSMFGLIGLGMVITEIRSRGIEKRLEGTEAEISFRSYRHGRVIRDRTFPRQTVTGIRASASGSSNGKTMKRVELIAGDTAEKLAWWIDGDLAEQFVTEARAALG